MDMQLHTIRATAVFVLLSFLLPPVFAYGSCTIEAEPIFTCSPWAENVLQESYRMKFGPDYEESDFYDMTSPVRRMRAFIYTERFLAIQFGCTSEAFYHVVNCLNAEEFYTSDSPKAAFSDNAGDVRECDALYYLGIVQGREAGILDGGSTITRQEAATILLRTYQLYGGILEPPETLPIFLDSDLIAPWAEEAVYTLTSVGIFQGYDNGCFGPLDEITHEQYLITLYRLYDNMPVSAKEHNVTSLFTQEELVTLIQTWDADFRSTRFIRSVVSGPVADCYELEVGRGSRYAHISPVLVFHSGAVKYIEDLGVCNTGRGILYAYFQLEDLHFSTDGKTLCYTVTLPEGIADLGNQDNYKYDIRHGHPAGRYNIAVNIDTLAVTTEYTPLSAEQSSPLS